MPSKFGLLGILTIFIIVSITLYFAFAFPYTLFHLKQTETTEIKSVIIIARNGEKSPKLESYFIGETPPDELNNLIGYDQLTNIGKERMFLLGKFLKLRYYHLLLNGNPRKLKIRSSIKDKCLESAQALLAGLNPPKDNWFWSTTGELENWQPKAIQTTDEEFDDLLSEEQLLNNCYSFQDELLKWKNSTKYQQLLNEFRHDLQLLRSNTGLEFEDDLEIVTQIDDSLKTRKAYKFENLPNWYTTTFSNRLSYISDVTIENRFKSENMQRLYVGRLLHEIAEIVNNQIKLHQQSLIEEEQQQQLKDKNVNNNNNNNDDSSTKINNNNNNVDDDPDLLVYANKNEISSSIKEKKQTTSLFGFGEKINNNNFKQSIEPNMFIFLTNKNKLSALMNSLQIYSSQPIFGSLLLIEVHYDPINNLHFLRLYSVSSLNPNVLPEPLRLNPIACVDSAECDPQQFEQNIRHLMLDKNLYQEICINKFATPSTIAPKLPLSPLISDNVDQPAVNYMKTTAGTTTTTMIPSTITTITDPSTTNVNELNELTTTTNNDVDSTTINYNISNYDNDNKLEQNLIVGPPSSSNLEENQTTTSTIVIDDQEKADFTSTQPNLIDSSSTISDISLTTTGNDNNSLGTSSPNFEENVTQINEEATQTSIINEVNLTSTDKLMETTTTTVTNSDKKEEFATDIVDIKPFSQSPSADFLYDNMNTID